MKKSNEPLTNSFSNSCNNAIIATTSFGKKRINTVKKSILIPFGFILGILQISPQTVQAAEANLDQIKRDAQVTGEWTGQPIVSYVVPALSGIRRLPDVVPTDGRATKNINVIAAQGEFEPASFVVFALQDFAKVELKASDLIGKSGQIPSSAIDLKVIKVWYQGGTAWSSYFADPTHRELIPELLLNDENLIKVDTKTQDNYLRYDGPAGKYGWISYPQGVKTGTFNHDTEQVVDRATLQPVSLVAGQGKQFWITIKIPDQAKEGVYKSSITLTADRKQIGEMTLNVRVLPFSLPVPKTYYDLEREFYGSIYTDSSLFERLRMNGMDFKQGEKKLLAEFKDMADHNIKNPLLRTWREMRDSGYQGKGREIAEQELKIYKESGLQTKPLFGALRGFDYGATDPKKPEGFADFKSRADEQLSIIEKALGHRDVYASVADEPSMKGLVSERECWKYIQSLGAHIWSTSSDKHLIYAGYNEDFGTRAGFAKQETARKWHAIGARITSYAGPHTGPENPDYIRRTHGMQLYKADYDATMNYIYYLVGGENIWNEFDHGVYRCFNMVYPTRDGVIDTIQWEGLREGIDDIRYATKLRELAAQAVASKDVNVQYTGKLALQWLSLLDENKADLNSVRLEMINYILEIQSALKGKAS